MGRAERVYGQPGEKFRRQKHLMPTPAEVSDSVRSDARRLLPSFLEKVKQQNSLDLSSLPIVK